MKFLICLISLFSFTILQAQENPASLKLNVGGGTAGDIGNNLSVGLEGNLMDNTATVEIVAHQGQYGLRLEGDSNILPINLQEAAVPGGGKYLLFNLVIADLDYQQLVRNIKGTGRDNEHFRFVLSPELKLSLIGLTGGLSGVKVLYTLGVFAGPSAGVNQQGFGAGAKYGVEGSITAFIGGQFENVIPLSILARYEGTVGLPGSFGTSRRGDVRLRHNFAEFNADWLGAGVKYEYDQLNIQAPGTTPYQYNNHGVTGFVEFQF